MVVGGFAPEFAQAGDRLQQTHYKTLRHPGGAPCLCGCRAVRIYLAAPPVSASVVTRTPANFRGTQRITGSTIRFIRTSVNLSGRLTLRPVDRKVIGSSPTSGATVLNTIRALVKR